MIGRRKQGRVDRERFAQQAPPRLIRDASPEIVERYRSEIQRVSEIILDHDPVRIGGMPDEYAPEARTIVARLATLDHPPSLTDAVVIIHGEFTYWFDSEIAGPQERYRELAEDVVEYWNAPKES